MQITANQLYRSARVTELFVDYFATMYRFKNGVNVRSQIDAESNVHLNDSSKRQSTE